MNSQESQKDKFKKAARGIGCDESESSFEDKLRKIAKAKPSPEKIEGKAGGG